MKRRSTHSLVIAGVFGLIGTVTLLAARAATPTASLEVESGTKTTNAATVADTTASGGSAIKFSAPATPPPTGNACDPATAPALPSTKPDATNTGVPAGTSLTNSSSITVSTAGTTIDARNITGTITINANNVTIKNSKLAVNGYYGITQGDGVTGTKLINNEIYTTGGGYEGFLGGNAFVCGNYIHGFENPITLTEGNAIIQNNYIDKLVGNSAGPHYDGIEVYAGNNYKIWGNNIRMTNSSDNWLGDTGAINVTPVWGKVDNLEIRGNWLGGGSFTLNNDTGQMAKPNLTKYTVINNVWYGSSPAGFAAYGPVREESAITCAFGNTWSNSGALVITNDVASAAGCDTYISPVSF